MGRLILAAAHAHLGRLGLPLLILWILLAAFLATGGGGPVGPTPLGDYLALITLFPALLCFRLAGVAERRLREGWPTEELLRDPRGWRMPLADFAAAALILSLGLGLALLPGTTTRFERAAAQGVERTERPVLVRAEGSAWSFRFPAPVPPGAHLSLLFTWDRASEQDLELVTEAGSRAPLRPGQFTELPLQPREAREGLVRAPSLPGLQPVRDFARLVVPVPPPSTLPRLLLGILLFFAPLLALTLALARHGTRAGIAALGALAVGGLAAWRPLPASGPPGAPLEFLARGVEALSRVLPPVEGLLATGTGFEIRYQTTPPWATLLWLLLGLLCLALTRGRPQRR